MSLTLDPVPLDSIELGARSFWERPEPEREAAFATLRREAPIQFFAETEWVPGFDVGPGFWALTRHADVWHASRHPALFSSVPSIVIPDQQPEVAEFFGSMIAIDDPRHFRLRSIVQKAFTPKMVAQVEAAVAERARRLVARMVERHPDRGCDFVAEFAAPLPLQIICAMMGIPEEDEERVFAWTNVILGVGDDEMGDYEAFERVAQEVAAYGIAMAEERRVDPRDDLTTALVQAEVDGDRLSSMEIASFFILLATAGNETTRNAISHGLVALTEHPDQRERWWADFDTLARPAAEEIVRWASPVIYMRRRATQDTEIGGVPIAEGDKVVMYYNSANRDESHFEDPYRFDVSRAPNDHVGYGAGGPHFCLGANLARREIMVAFHELHEQVPEIRATGEPAMLVSSFIHGIKRLECAW
ncbi:MAG: cytochrome P450 [Ilumatobacteraceae bacterium]|nr:cytochrome P450 [Ilumatobacteraceae bacterium]